MKDQLFIMTPGFMNDDKGPFYCGDSVSVEGLLGFFPELRKKIDVTYIDFPRPRQAIIDLLDTEHQSVPVLILSPDSDTAEAKTINGRMFIDDEKAIRAYLSATCNLPAAG